MDMEIVGEYGNTNMIVDDVINSLNYNEQKNKYIGKMAQNFQIYLLTDDIQNMQISSTQSNI